MAVRTFNIVDHNGGGGYYTVDASLTDSGVFRLDGHDVGGSVGEFWPGHERVRVDPGRPGGGSAGAAGAGSVTERDPIVLGQGPKRCGLYWSGHEVHMIHGLKSGNDREPDRVPATVIAVRPDGRVTLDVEGQPQEYWNHDPAGLAAAARGVDHGIELDRRWRLLRIPTAPGSMLVFYLARPDDHRACPLGPI